MIDLTTTQQKQKIGEIAVISSSFQNREKFIGAVCNDTITTNQDVIFGRLSISDDLSLFLYGIGTDEQGHTFAWDLVGQKVLGFIIIYDWYDKESFSNIRKSIEFINEQFDSPIIISANVGENSYPVPKILYRPSINMTLMAKFTFHSNQDSKSVKKILVDLIDTAIEHIP